MSECNQISTTLPVGPEGDQGLYGGFSTAFEFDTSTSATPASKKIRFNSATYTAVTNLFISDTNKDSIDVDLFLDSFSNSSAFGWVRVFKEDDSTIFWIGKVTAVTDNGTDHTIAVTYVLHNGSFAANNSAVVSFIPKGDAGTAATNPGVHTETTTQSTTAGAWTNFPSSSYTKDVAALTMSTTGNREDRLVVTFEGRASFTVVPVVQTNEFRLLINGDTANAVVVPGIGRDCHVRVEADLFLISNTSCQVFYKIYAADPTSGFIFGNFPIKGKTSVITIPDHTTTAVNIRMQGQIASGTGTAFADMFNILNLKK